MVVDFHCHSTCSDGQLSPSELLALALNNGVTHLAITDHDSIQAYQQDLPLSGLELISGVEFSTQWRGIGIHIVGLNFQPGHTAIVNGALQQTKVRRERAEAIAAKLSRHGVQTPLQGALKYSSGDFVGRPHFAQYLVECGAARDINQAFKRYLSSAKMGHIDKVWAEMETVIGWIRQAGGQAVLAHPFKYNITRTKLCALLDDFIHIGGTALEVVSGQQTPQQTRDLARLCNDKKLLASTGSDFHLPGQPWAALGRQPKLPENCEPVWQAWR